MTLRLIKSPPLTRIAIIPRIVQSNEDTDRRGSIWIARPNVAPSRDVIESSTARSLRLELETFFERLIGEDIELAAYEGPTSESKAGVQVVTSIVPCRVVRLDVKKIYEVRPFDRREPFQGKRLLNFVPDWYVPPERPPLMHAIDVDQYGCPDIPDDRRNKRKQSRKKREELEAQIKLEDARELGYVP